MDTAHPRTRPVAAAVLAVLTCLVAVAFAPAAQAAVAGRNLPPDGKIRFFMGQDSSTLADYKRDVLDPDPGAPRPGGVTLYTNLVFGGTPGPLGGFYGPVDYGSGVVDFPATLAQYPGAALAVGLYLSDASAGCNNQPLRAIIGTGDADVVGLTPQYRAKVDEMVTWLRNTNREVFLRIGYEFDGPWNCYNADFYKAAFRYVKGRIDALGATRVATVWQSAGWPIDEHPGNPEWNYIVTAPNHFDVWYPGDAYVDWVGMSAFYGANYASPQWSCRAPSTSPRALQNRVLGFARAHSKPVMVAEAAPQGFTTGSKTQSCIFSKAPAGTTGDAIWTNWYADFFSYVAANADVIRAIAYINTHWDAQTQWQCTGAAGGPTCANGYWGDSRVQADPTIRSRFLAEARNARYVGGTTGPVDRTVVNTGSNRCLDVSGGRTTDGTKVQLWDCLNNPAQRWRWNGQSLVNPNSGKCLDIAGGSTADGASVRLWTCLNNGAQQWVSQPNGNLVNPPSGKCLDAAGWGTANGTAMILWTCGPGPQSNQTWRFN